MAMNESSGPCGRVSGVRSSQGPSLRAVVVANRRVSAPHEEMAADMAAIMIFLSTRNVALRKPPHPEQIR